MLLKKANNFIYKALFFGKVITAGRSNTGIISIRHRGAGVARSFRIIDYIKYLWNVRGLLLTFEYDSGRTAVASLIAYTNGVFAYILTSTNAPVATISGNINISHAYEHRINYCANLNYIKPGLYINNLEIKPLFGSKYIRTGSSYAKLVSIAEDYSIIKLRSQFLLRISNLCVATIGVLLNRKNYVNSSFNAGWNRRLGWRSSVRGVAMNPIDHPHGGGQGKTSGGQASVTPWGKITKGKKTRKNKYGSFVLKR